MSTFKLNEEQKKLCHELTMECIRQNQTFKKENPDSKMNFGDRFQKAYFNIYEEFAIAIHERWDSIQEIEG